MAAPSLRAGRRAVANTWLPLALIGAAFLFRVAGLISQSLWRDEVDALIFATRPLPQLLETFRKPGENGPLFFLALRPWLAAAGHSEFALRFPAALLGTLGVAVGYALTRRLAGRKPALLSALLLASAPYLVWYGQEAKMYAALTALVPASLWLTLAVAQRGGLHRWVALYVVTSLCFYTHVLAALIVPVQALWLLILPSRAHRSHRWLAVAAYLAILVLPYSPMIWWQAKLWLSPTFETGHPFVTLFDILKVLAVAFSRGILPVEQPLTLLPAMLGLVAGVGLWATGRRHQAMIAPRRTVTLLLVWLLLPPLAIYGVSLGMPIFADRYLVWMAPPFLILAALGVSALARTWRPLGLITLAALLALNGVSLWVQATRPIKSDFRAAAQYVVAHYQPGDLLVFQISYVRRTFMYYSSDQIDPDDASLPWLDGPFTNNSKPAAEFDSYMAQGTAEYSAAWLIASEAATWDRRGLTESWLAAHGSVTDHAEFARVNVTRYVLRGPQGVTP